MKNLNETEELFDSIFRESLENSSAPVPPGVWEGVTSSIGSGSAIAGVAAKTAIWMKVAIAVVAVSAVSLIAYQFGNNDEVAPSSDSAKQETPASESQVKPEQTVIVDAGISQTNPSNNHSKNPNTNKTSTTEMPGLMAPPDLESGPNPIFSIDANLINPEIIPHATEPAANVGDKPLVEEPVKVSEEPKELNPTTEYTYIKDSSSIFIPTAVTADGDGINDTYLINLVGEESVEIIIYSIENEVLFRTKNKYQAWNCKLPNGDDAPAGSYLVKVIYKFKGKEKQTTVRKLTIIK